MHYLSTKTFDNSRGLSCCFRQWKATHSHCSKLHGYSIGVKITFISKTLDDKNWVYDFGNTKWIKELLEQQFDHTTIIANDDPELDLFLQMYAKGIIDLRVVEAVGCEKFAEWVFNQISLKVSDESGRRVLVKSVEVFEHGANSAIYEG